MGIRALHGAGLSPIESVARALSKSIGLTYMARWRVHVAGYQTRSTIVEATVNVANQNICADDIAVTETRLDLHSKPRVAGVLTIKYIADMVALNNEIRHTCFENARSNTFSCKAARSDDVIVKVAWEPPAISIPASL